MPSLARPISFRAGELETPLKARTDSEEVAALAETARRDLTRYYDLLWRSLPTFTEGEASLLCDVCNGTRWESHSMTLLWAEVSDAVEEGYAAKWEVDGPAFVERLRRMTPAENFAIIDACERFWSGPYHREDPIAEKLRAVGLVRSEE